MSSIWRYSGKITLHLILDSFTLFIWFMFVLKLWRTVKFSFHCTASLPLTNYQKGFLDTHISAVFWYAFKYNFNVVFWGFYIGLGATGKWLNFVYVQEILLFPFGIYIIFHDAIFPVLKDYSIDNHSQIIDFAFSLFFHLPKTYLKEFHSWK